jgi:hypothetical protein
MNRVARRQRAAIVVAVAFIAVIIAYKNRVRLQPPDIWLRLAPTAAILLGVAANRRARAMLALPSLSRRFWTKYNGASGVWESMVLGVAAEHKDKGASPPTPMRAVRQVHTVRCADNHVHLLHPMWCFPGHQDVCDTIYLRLFRVDEERFELLHQLHGYRMAAQHSRWRMPVDSRKRMGIFLNWLAYGHTQDTMSLHFAVGQSTISGILREGVETFYKHMVEDGGAFTVPTGQALWQVQQGFASQGARMPYCIGAVDGTFFRIQSPQQWSSEFWCYKKKNAASSSV